MEKCPVCEEQALERGRDAASGVPYWRCPKCDGRLFTFSAFGKIAGRNFSGRIWSAARAAGARVCRTCTHPMLVGARYESPVPLEFDVCKTCFVIWCDAGEWPETRTLEAESEDEEASRARRERTLVKSQEEVFAEDPELRKTYARSLLELEKMKAGGPERERFHPPEEFWKYIPAFFGLPVEINSHAYDRRPIVNLTFCGFLFLVFIWQFRMGLDTSALTMGFVPSDPWRHGGTTILTSMILHGDIFHLLGNVYALWVFGDNVENDLGPVAYAVLLLGSHLLSVCGNLVAGGSIPVIGASGALYGVLGYYMLTFHRSQLALGWFFLFRFFWWRLPAFWVLGYMVAREILMSVFLGSGSGVAHMAHVGGALFGFVVAKFAHPSETVASPEGDANDPKKPPR